MGSGFTVDIKRTFAFLLEAAGPKSRSAFRFFEVSMMQWSGCGLGDGILSPQNEEDVRRPACENLGRETAGDRSRALIPFRLSWRLSVHPQHHSYPLPQHSPAVQPFAPPEISQDISPSSGPVQCNTKGPCGTFCLPLGSAV